MFLPPIVDPVTANPVNRRKWLLEGPVESEQPNRRIIVPNGISKGRAMLPQVVVPIPVVRNMDISRVVSILVSDNDIVFLQQRLNVLYELRSGLLGLDIVALRVPETKDMFKSH